MYLYHVSFDIGNSEKYLLRKTFTPRIPENRALVEDSMTPRISFSTTIENCLSSVPANNRNWDIGKIRVYEFEVDDNDENIIRPEQLVSEGLVDDAVLTQEYWYLKEVTLDGVLKEFKNYDCWAEYIVFECNREDIYGVLINDYKFTDEMLEKLDNITAYDIINLELNEEEYWDISNQLSDEVAEKVGLHNMMKFGKIEFI